MCGNGLIGMAQAQLRTTAATPAGTLRAHPGREIEATAEIQDLGSDHGVTSNRSLTASVAPGSFTLRRKLPKVVGAMGGKLIFPSSMGSDTL